MFFDLEGVVLDMVCKSSVDCYWYPYLCLSETMTYVV